MGWSIGYDNNWKRDVGYGVPAICDQPKCTAEIDRGLSFVCGGDPYGGDYGCGLYFCSQHLFYRQPRGAESHIQLCPRCYAYKSPYNPKPDTKEWVKWKLKDKSWEKWRKENPEEVKLLLSKVAKENKDEPSEL